MTTQSRASENLIQRETRYCNVCGRLKTHCYQPKCDEVRDRRRQQELASEYQSEVQRRTYHNARGETIGASPWVDV